MCKQVFFLIKCSCTLYIPINVSMFVVWFNETNTILAYHCAWMVKKHSTVGTQRQVPCIGRCRL
jgi:hypothetical protein